MTSATDELRRILDERGVEWRGGLPTETMVREPIDALYVERPDGRMHVYFRSYITPEQAIEATLGRGTCRETIIDHYWRGCGLCGYIWEFMYGIGKCERPRYCPNCGRKVVDSCS